MKRLGFAVTAALMIAGCASTGRMLSYGTDLSDAVVRMGPAAFSIYIHPKDDTLLIQRRMMQTSAHDGPELITIAAQTFLDPIGCTAGPSASLGPGSWETTFSCPSSVDIRTLARQQRAALQSGTPIHP
ncbi:hypothetical protein [Brevundimonas sp. Marseille-Q4549]|jgi:hypothetical protein